MKKRMWRGVRGGDEERRKRGRSLLVDLQNPLKNCNPKFQRWRQNHFKEEQRLPRPHIPK